LNVGILTGVRREYRRQGVATALKVQTIAYAKQHGFREIVTKTANPAMLSLMEKLGFQHESGEVRLLKALLPPPLRGVT
jgi:GNAT superfamily N-acetyltransferase